MTSSMVSIFVRHPLDCHALVQASRSCWWPLAVAPQQPPGTGSQKTCIIGGPSLFEFGSGFESLFSFSLTL